MMVWDDPHIERVSVFAIADVPNEQYLRLIEGLKEFMTESSSLILRFVGARSVGESWIATRLVVASHRTSDETRHLSVEADARRRSQSPPTSARNGLTERDRIIREAMMAIAKFSLHCDAECTVTWSFPVEQAKPVITLPLLQFDDLGLPFQRISGVRLTDSRNNPDEYTTISLVGESKLQLVSRFVTPRTMSADILEQAAAEGRTRRSGFVTVIGESSREQPSEEA
jgi:hypothetical protein